MTIDDQSDGEAPTTISSGGYRFGAFKGVFTPSILTILGVVMYLRLGWVLGQMGLGRTLLIVVMSCSITFLTGLSLAALATNMRVRLGGAYYIISRSLGIEAGAAIGVPLFLAQAVGIAFYLIGFAESVNVVFPAIDQRILALVTLVIISLLAARSADLALRAQFLVMALIAASLASFFLGLGSLPSASATPGTPMASTTGLPFWVVFAVFFPAVTGIEAGLSMSGDLKNPARALPLGTLAAVIVGLILYLAIPIVFHLSGIERAVLIGDSMAMQRVARWPALIAAGLWAAALSSALGAMLGAPRTLQALARDRVVFSFLGRGYGKGGDPRLASAVAFAIAMATILLGDLNRIAPVLSMFFLTSYGLLNLSAGLETLISPASWRPRLRLRSVYPLSGFFGCVIVMLMINPSATLIAWTVAGMIFYLMKRRDIKARWGDLRRGLILTVMRRSLYTLARLPPEARTWQPNVLVLSGLPSRRWHLVEIADALCKGRGLMTVAFVVPREGYNTDRQVKIRTTIANHLRRVNIEALVCVYPHEDSAAGALNLVTTYGLGPLVPNILVLGHVKSTSAEQTIRFGNLLRSAYAVRKNVIIVSENNNATDIGATFSALNDLTAVNGTVKYDDEAPRRIDVWWGMKSLNRDLMLALTVLMQRSERWAGARVRLMIVVEADGARQGAEDSIRKFLASERINAEPQVLVHDGESVFEMIASTSANAGLVLMGLRPPSEDESDADYGRYCSQLATQTGDFPLLVLVLAGEAIPFAELFASADAGRDS